MLMHKNYTFNEILDILNLFLTLSEIQKVFIARNLMDNFLETINPVLSWKRKHAMSDVVSKTFIFPQSYWEWSEMDENDSDIFWQTI